MKLRTAAAAPVVVPEWSPSRGSYVCLSVTQLDEGVCMLFWLVADLIDPVNPVLLFEYLVCLFCLQVLFFDNCIHVSLCQTGEAIDVRRASS